jgi:Doubled CXXCH motif (Paired_CXXCH_1).
MKSLKVLLSIAVVIVALPMFAADAYHAGQYANCSDCHTMHASIHDNHGATQVDAPSSPVTAGGTGVNAWLPVQGDAEHYLLKGTEASICIACHDGKTFAPDVVGANSFTAGGGTAVRAGGFLDGTGGHQLGSTIVPPGFNPLVIGAVAGTESKVYDPAGGLECLSCHGAHGSQTVYRQLAPYSWGSSNGGPNIRSAVQPKRAVAASPTLVIDGSVDVNIGVAAYAPGTAGYYEASSITYIKNPTTVLSGQTSSNNRYDTFCAACHGQFHGGATGQGATATALDTNGNVFDDTAKLFVRHPTAGVKMGSNASTYNSAVKTGWQKAPMYVTTQTTNPNDNDTPGCVSCHKAHGNNNPFGLLYVGPGALTEGGSASGSYVSLCHQCHGMGTVTPQG